VDAAAGHDVDYGDYGQAAATAAVERHPSKKRYGHQPSQVGSRPTGKSSISPSEFLEDVVSANPGCGAAGTGAQEVGGSSRAPTELREFSFAEEGQ